MASLIITQEGDTLDCRQWQRVIAKPGKVTFFDDEWVNVNKQMRVMTLDLEGNELHYDKLKMRKVDKPTVECQQALDKQAQPDATPQPQPQPSTVPAASTTFIARQPSFAGRGRPVRTCMLADTERLRYRAAR